MNRREDDGSQKNQFYIAFAKGRRKRWFVSPRREMYASGGIGWEERKRIISGCQSLRR